MGKGGRNLRSLQGSARQLFIEMFNFHFVLIFLSYICLSPCRFLLLYTYFLSFPLHFHISLDVPHL